jgi:hypothetical protein
MFKAMLGASFCSDTLLTAPFMAKKAELVG